MPDSSFLTLALALSLGAATSSMRCAQAGVSPAHAAAIGDSVRRTLADLSGKMARGRWDSAGAYYSNSSDFRWVEEGKVVARSAGDIRHYLTGMRPTMQIQTTYANIETAALAPGVASVLTDFSTTMADSGSAGFTFAGEITMTMIHEPEGWVILNGHSSAPHPH